MITSSGVCVECAVEDDNASEVVFLGDFLDNGDVRDVFILADMFKICFVMNKLLGSGFVMLLFDNNDC